MSHTLSTYAIECMSVTPGARWNGSFYEISVDIWVDEDSFEPEDDVDEILEAAEDDSDGRAYYAGSEE